MTTWVSSFTALIGGKTAKCLNVGLVGGGCHVTQMLRMESRECSAIRSICYRRDLATWNKQWTRINSKGKKESWKSNHKTAKWLFRTERFHVETLLQLWPFVCINNRPVLFCLGVWQITVSCTVLLSCGKIKRDVILESLHPIFYMFPNSPELSHCCGLDEKVFKLQL